MLALARMDVRIGIRGAAFRVLAVLAFALGAIAGATPGRGVSYSAYATGEAAWQYLGLIAVGWMALTAVRDVSLRTFSLVYSKPQTNERLVLAQFASAFAQVLLVLAAMFAGAICGRLYAGGGLVGFPAYGLQYVRAACVLFFASSAAYCLALLAESPVAGMLVGVYWVVMVAGREFLAKPFFPQYTQNLPVYLLLGAFLLCITLIFHRRSRRGATPTAGWVRIATPLALAATSWLLWTVIRDGHDPQLRTNPVLETIGQQNIAIGRRTPGFLLPDQNGKLRSLSDYPDRILLVALWSPADLESSRMLAELNRVYERYGPRGVLPVAVCVSEDVGAAATFAMGERLRFPVLADWGTYHAPEGSEKSPVASAYSAGALPAVYVTDRRRRALVMFSGISSFNTGLLEQAVQERLREEPR